jgi:general secretion pathway protein M
MRTLQSIHAWWQARDARERRMLAIMSVMVATFVYWYGLLTPLQMLRERARSGYDHAAAELIVVTSQADEIQARQARQAEATLSAGQLIESAGKAGVSISRQRSDDRGALVIGIEAVDAATLFRWLESLRQSRGTAPSGLEIEKKNGQLQAEVSFAIAGGAP